MKIFCDHEWETKVDMVTESEIEVYVRLGIKPSKGGSWMSERKHIFICTCKNCGRLIKTVERI